MNKVTASIDETIKTKIYTIRGMQVMLDSDLAELYGVETKNLNRAVNRNSDRFPQNFMFQLSEEEHQNLKSQFATSSLSDSLRFQNGTLDDEESLRSQFVTLENSRGKHRKYLPYVFTEQGVAMLSAVLRSQSAVQMSIHIINAFVEMRKFISNNALIFQRLDSLEQKQSKTDEKVEAIFNAIEDRSIKPKQGIFYDGQVYDAYLLVSDLIKSAKESIILIDNYVDESVLTLLSKRDMKVNATIYTKNITKQLELDLQKYNTQYPTIELKKFDSSHDRFLLIDEKEVYHIGASLKDLGKKWFAFSKLDMGALNILEKLNNE
ncbi:ORF6N domain-containing protein [Sulfuricurvum sp. RIFCSPLOWO2_12_FULL_43_24]|uniref:ORF6N domain-containing protein n=1 Tax=Sulfuricurvum sp. RIFCSPLOWO2_12_FULL_43_24 TaxID=1802247 RepID=UPI0008D16158|nr:ORF6N domain-containing protein [Sulfuricurvum sp. RIFCSPLOWO2_12_FULL_43_24]OHD89654.1 MAG: DNA-binding protein [Sulfuricurvum sp. RIFCSPLOWO2_12_FULL_43_24]